MVNDTPRPLHPEEGNLVAIALEDGWAPEPELTGAENIAPTAIRFQDCPARSESLCRLSYRGPPLANRYVLEMYKYLKVK